MNTHCAAWSDDTFDAKENARWYVVGHKLFPVMINGVSRVTPPVVSYSVGIFDFAQQVVSYFTLSFIPMLHS